MEVYMNIILIGMPASGKSTVGVVLAKLLGFDYVDTDILIQRSQGKCLEHIIAEKGMEAFLALEEEICSRLDVFNTVVATGGSVIYSEAAMRHLSETGPVVYLKTDLPELSRRIGDMRQRGVVLKPGQTMENLYQERVPLYERWADFTMEGESIEHTAERIKAVITNYIESCCTSEEDS